jgi:hypothetical protein
VPSDPSASGLPGPFVAFLVFVGIFFVVWIILSVWTFIWKSNVLRRGGLNPIVAEEQLEAQLYQNLRAGPPVTATTPEKSKEERLSEVMDLHERGLISDAELADARAKIISG